MRSFTLNHRTLRTMPVKRALRSSTSASNAATPVDHAKDTETVATSSEAPSKDAGLKPPNERRKRKTKPTNLPPKRIRLHTPEASIETLSNHANIYHRTAMAPPYRMPTTDNSALSLDRPVEPHRTNAPVITPRGSRLVTYSQNTFDESPSKTGVPRPTTTTGQILEEACAHLIKTDPKMQPLIEKHYCRVFSPEGLSEECDPFKSLCSTIMGQQVL